MMRFPLRCAVVGAAAALLAATAGCLQLETLIRVHQDGSATITERLQFSERLLDMSRTAGPDLDVAPLLTKKAALERMKEMGAGMTLVSHEVRDAERGARESVTVFKIPDISNFQYVSPYLAVAKYPKHVVLKCTMFPVYTSTWYGRRAGQMAVTFKPATQERRSGKPAEPPPPPPPSEVQALRELEPLFRDLMEGLSIKITFEAYEPLRFRTYYRYRGQKALTTKYDLIDFTDDNLDKYGGKFLENEEIVLELMQIKPGGANVVSHTKGHAENESLPVYHPTGTPEIYFRPSRQLFDKHFAGKTLHFDKRAGGDKPAKFKEIGHKAK